MRIAIVSGGFDPVHSGHVALIRGASIISAGPVVVVLNSDGWLARKKGQPFMPWRERAAVIGAFSGVLEVVAAEDRDGTIVDSLYRLRARFPTEALYFCNGGDRTEDNTPEQDACMRAGITTYFGVGGAKTQSSSALIAAAAAAGR